MFGQNTSDLVRGFFGETNNGENAPYIEVIKICEVIKIIIRLV